MATRDYESAPESEKLGIDTIIRGLASDLHALRAGTITVPDAMARAHLAKQIFNGCRIYLNAAKMLGDQAKPANPSVIEGEKPVIRHSRLIDEGRA
jgi:hypothetical protein